MVWKKCWMEELHWKCNDCYFLCVCVRVWLKGLLFFRSESNQSVSPFTSEPPCWNSHISSTSFFPPPNTDIALVCYFLSHPASSCVIKSFMWFTQYHFLQSRFYLALNSKWDERGREGDQVVWGLICILQRWHSNCHPTLLFLFVFYYSLSRSHISHTIHLTYAVGQSCGLTFSLNGPIITPLCHSPLLSSLQTLHLSLLPPNLCRQY